MVTIRCKKERVWLHEYEADSKFASLKWAWTLEWTNATRYATQEAAEKRAKELIVPGSSMETEYFIDKG